MKIQTTTQIDETTFNQIINRDGSASQKMIDLFNLGIEVSEIAKLLGKRYNHVYNVVTNAINTKKIDASNIDYSAKGSTGTKKQQIQDMFAKGMKKSDIAKELGCHQQQVYQALKDYVVPEVPQEVPVAVGETHSADTPAATTETDKKPRGGKKIDLTKTDK